MAPQRPCYKPDVLESPWYAPVDLHNQLEDVLGTLKIR